MVTRSHPPLIGGPFGDRFGIVTRMDGLPDFAAEYDGATTVDLGEVQIRVLPLRRILVSKRVANRPKDALAVAQIEQTLRVLGALDDE